MQTTPAKLLDVVALLDDKPSEGLVAGQVGTIVEIHSPGVFEVEFLDSDGRTIALAELRREELLVLKHELVAAGTSQ
ncbi:DUF4926 domain-containing protein [Candidatus Sumerlaeota bacterium]|nr:DUF4926 domain-containing protein [Candidatus Sumerlaeota bacterium]